MKLPTIEDFDFSEKRVFLRGDLDIPVEGNEVVENDRLRFVVKAVEEILKRGASQIILVGHKGRPEGKVDEKLSLVPLGEYLSNKISSVVPFCPYHYMSRIFDSSLKSPEIKLILLENIRFWAEERENRDEFAKGLASTVDVYVNDAFGSSHRTHTSIVGVPRFVPSFAGPHFVDEVTNLSKVIENPKKPVVFSISGAKKDKLDYLDDIKARVDKVMLAGLLPTFLPEDYTDDKVLLARLIADREDITMNSVEQFVAEIVKAGTVVISGPLGKFEEEGHRQGTRKVMEAVVGSGAFKVAGGGDTEAALEMLNLKDGFDWVSTGGGAMLEFLAKGTLPGIEALLG